MKIGALKETSSGEQLRNWVELSHLCDCILKQSTGQGPICLHVSGYDMSILELAQSVARSWQKQFGTKVEIVVPEYVLELKEPQRKFRSIYGNTGERPNFEAFVSSVGVHLFKSRKKLL